MKRLENKVAIVTGGSSGLGRAMVELFVAEGAKVALCSNDVAEGEAALKELNAKYKVPDRVRFHATDMGKPDTIQEFVEDVVDGFGPPDIVVNNAAVMQMFHTAETTLEMFETSINVNVRGYWYLAKTVHPYMKSLGAGSIINIASTQAYQTRIGSFPYNLSKGAILALNRALALDYGPDGIRVNAVLPGIVDTNLTREWLRQFKDRDAKLKSIVDSHAIPRMPTAEEVAQAVLFLANDESSGITGIELVVDAGRQIKRRD